MNIFLGFVSMSGNTEDIANLLSDELQGLAGVGNVHSYHLDAVDVMTLEEYDCFLIGAYTWGDGDLPYEVEDFFDELANVRLVGKKVACFGSGDHIYPKFCMAVDVMAERLADQGCEVFEQRLKMELSPEDDVEQQECKSFARSFFSWVSQKEDVHV